MPDGGGDERPRLRLVRWRKVHRGHLVGFADVELPIGLKITDVMVIAKDGKVFCNLPSRPRLRADANGVHQIERGADGKPVYDTMLAWRTRELGERFSERVVAAVRGEYPADLPRPVQGSG